VERGTGLERGDERLTAFVDRILLEAARRAGSHLACRPGCTECCVGPFPITQLDALRLRRGLEELAARDPLRGARLSRRARNAAAVLAADLPEEDRSRILSSEDASSEAFYLRHEALACPALDPETGLCELYAHRPVSCRTFGPPVLLEGVPLPPCRLCFTKASNRQIDACRVEVDCGDLEAPLLERLETQAGLNGETLVAFALSGASFLASL
jgi:Fe-S-cluster containining protein